MEGSAKTSDMLSVGLYPERRRHRKRNSDFKKVRAYYQGGAGLKDVDLNWQLGLSRMDYGANTFYSGKYPNQYEENRRYMGSVSAQTKDRVVFTLDRLFQPIP